MKFPKPSLIDEYFKPYLADYVMGALVMLILLYSVTLLFDGLIIEADRQDAAHAQRLERQAQLK